jgi:hypothetical protein
MSKEKLLTIGTLTALCLLAVFSLHAKAAGQDGMVVVRDPQTGKMRAPTPDELKALRASAPASAGLAAPRAPSSVSRGDGSRGVRLGDKTMVYDVVTRGPDGKLTNECVHGEAGVGQALGHDHGEDAHESR